MDKKMKATIITLGLYRDYIGIMGHEMNTTTV